MSIQTDTIGKDASAEKKKGCVSLQGCFSFFPFLMRDYEMRQTTIASLDELIVEDMLVMDRLEDIQNALEELKTVAKSRAKNALKFGYVRF